MVKDTPVNADNPILSTKFVCPWVGVIANLQTKIGPNNKPVGKSRATLREDLIQRGFKPSKVDLIWDHGGHSGFAIVNFGNFLDGFEKAMHFERKSSLQGHGKSDYLNGTPRDSNIYGWVAREEDYLVSDAIGKKLRNGAYDVKSVKKISEEEERKLNQLVRNLPPSIDRESYYSEGMDKIRTNESRYEWILVHAGDADLENTPDSGEIDGSSGDELSEDDSSDDEDAPKKKKIRR